MKRRTSTALGEVQVYGRKVAEAVALRLAEIRWEGDESGPRLICKGEDIIFDPRRDPHQVTVTLKFHEHCTLRQLTIVIRLSSGSADWKSTYAAEAQWPGINQANTRHAGFAGRSGNGRITLPEQGSAKVAAAAT